MTAFGKANYDAYREFSHGTSMISGDPIPEWDKLPVHIQSAWDAAADGVALVLAECPVDQDMPGNEPAKVIVVRDDNGRDHRYAAPNFGTLHDGTLLIGDKRDNGDLDVDAGFAPGRWTRVHKDGAMTGDLAARKLGIAMEALRAIASVVLKADDKRRVPVGVARDAIEQIESADL